MTLSTLHRMQFFIDAYRLYREGGMEYGATIERGKIKEVRGGGKYIVTSTERDGIETPPIPAMLHIPAMIHNEKPYKAGDNVYFFMFSDGEGMILKKI